MDEQKKTRVESSSKPAHPLQQSKTNYVFHMVVGKGGFGRVWIVTSKNKRKYFALKEMAKTKILSKRSVHSVLNERKILSSLRNNFIVNIKCAFQDREKLYLLMDLLTGGDLRFHLCYFRRFSEVQTSIYN